MQSEATKRLRVIVWDCEQGKTLIDVQTDCLIGGVVKDDEEFGLIFVGKGGEEMQMDAIRMMRKGCRMIKQRARRESRK